MNIISTNKKAYHDYIISDKLEVGIVLTGSEVKSVRANAVSLDGAYVQTLKNELWLVGATIKRYTNSSDLESAKKQFERFPALFRSLLDKDKRVRKLLCHTKELRELKFKSEAKGFTLVPLKLYEKNSRFKLEIGIAKGKKVADKRHDLKNKDVKREIERNYK